MTPRRSLLVLLGAALLAGGCASAPAAREGRSPAPSSGLTREQALAFAALWARMPGHATSGVLPTGSMQPVLDSHSILLLETCTAAELRPGDIALYTKAADGTGRETIVHRVVAVRADGVLFDGDHNHASDGWIAPRRIRWRVAGTLYTRRDT